MGNKQIVSFANGPPKVIPLPHSDDVHDRKPIDITFKAKAALLCLVAVFAVSAPTGAQRTGPPKSVKADSTSDGLRDAAWSTLTDAVTSEKVRTRSDAVSALTILGPDPRAVRTIENELEDKDDGIRTFAATSLADMHARSAIPKLRKALDDPSPVVSFAAAQALWKLGDKSGRDLLYEVLTGERKATDGIVKRHVDTAKKELHDPKALALIGINEASGAFLGPFAMGISFAEEYAKNTSAPIQARCANLLASDNSSDTAEQLAGALYDKNWMVRAAAAKALAKMSRKELVPKLKEMMETDKDEPARLIAAAAILKLTEPVKEPVPSHRNSGAAPGTHLPSQPQ